MRRESVLYIMCCACLVVCAVAVVKLHHHHDALRHGCARISAPSVSPDEAKRVRNGDIKPDMVEPPSGMRAYAKAHPVSPIAKPTSDHHRVDRHQRPPAEPDMLPEYVRDVPNVSTPARAEDAASRNCRAILRQISSAKEVWAVDNRKHAEDTATLDDLAPYMSVKPKCLGGGVYTVGNLGQTPSCSVHGALR